MLGVTYRDKLETRNQKLETGNWEPSLLPQPHPPFRHYQRIAGVLGIVAH